MSEQEASGESVTSADISNGNRLMAVEEKLIFLEGELISLRAWAASIVPISGDNVKEVSDDQFGRSHGTDDPGASEGMSVKGNSGE